MTSKFTHKNKRIFVAGHTGLAGSSILNELNKKDCEVLTISSDKLDLRDQNSVEKWFKSEKPDGVYLAAATAGGIHANYSKPAEFIYNNLAIQNSVIHASYLSNVEKLCFLGSSCIYPRLAEQPMLENSLLTGPLDKHNIWYAISKIAGIYLCDGYSKQYGMDFISVMPANLYGPGDKITEENSHVVAALLDRFHKAKINNLKQVDVWGTGKARREFLYSNDMAEACVYLMENITSNEIINVGNSVDYTIKELADMISDCVGYKGTVTFDHSKPDGMPRKIVDSTKLENLGWKAKTSFNEGIQATYDWYLKNI
jgi:GDP-L-fucose synthase